MNTKAKISFNGKKIPGREQTVLEPAGCGPDVTKVDDCEPLRQVFVDVTLDVEDPRLALLQKLLLAYKVEWFEERWDEYTNEEYEAAPLILITSTYEVSVIGGPRFDTEYDLSSACPACGAGMRQTGAYVLDGTYGESIAKLAEFRAVASYCEILVDAPLAKTLEDAGLSGLSFRPVFAKQQGLVQTKLLWRQMWASHTLPPLSTRSTGLERDKVCKSCGRSKFHSTSPERFAYRARDLEGAKDVNRMWEYFGNGKWNGDLLKAVVWQPYFLVTPKVWRIFKDAGVTGFKWLPIRVVEDE